MGDVSAGQSVSRGTFVTLSESTSVTCTFSWCSGGTLCYSQVLNVSATGTGSRGNGTLTRGPTPGGVGQRTPFIAQATQPKP